MIIFGAGPRYCLGAELAKMEMKVFLASFARRVPKFRLREGSANVEWQPGMWNGSRLPLFQDH